MRGPSTRTADRFADDGKAPPDLQVHHGIRRGDFLDDCRITIAYDSEGLPGFQTGWGFSALVERGGARVLFDCGWDGRTLRSNLDRLGVHLADIGTVVISHSHWDHASGITEVLSDRRPEPVVVVVPSSFSQNLRREISRRAEVRVADGPLEVAPGIMSTGPLGGEVREQSLVLPSDEGSVVITGCAHPGVGEILERSSDFGRPAWLMGGFHDARAVDLPEYLERVVACHCTREKAGILERFRDRASVGMTGQSFTPWS